MEEQSSVTCVYLGFTTRFRETGRALNRLISLSRGVESKLKKNISRYAARGMET